MEELQLKLPLPLIHEDELITDFVPADLDGATMKLLSKSDRGSREFSGIARTVSLVTESIGNHPIKEPYVASGAKSTFPSLVLELPPVDLTYLLVASHVHNFGPEIKEVPIRCPRNRTCGREFVADVDLRQLQVDFREEPIEQLEVDLPRGYKVTGEGEFGGMVFKKLHLGLPTSWSLIKHEDHHRENEAFGDFEMKVLADCIINMFTEDGTEYGADQVTLKGDSIIRSMLAADIKAMAEAIGGTPNVELVFDFECSFCGAEFRGGIDTGFLFPRGRE